MLSNIVGGFIVIIVGVTLAAPIANEVGAARFPRNETGSLIEANMSSSASTILGLTVLFYNLAVATTAIGISIVGLKNSGLM